MSHAIYRQPNGKWCIFSTVVGDWIMADAEKKDVVEYYVEKERERITEKLDDIESGEYNPHPMQHSYDEAVEIAGREPSDL